MFKKNGEILLSFQPEIHFSCINVRTKTSNTFQNRTGKHGYPFLSHDIWEMLVFFLIKHRQFSFIHSLLNFFLWIGWNYLPKLFSVSASHEFLSITLLLYFSIGCDVLCWINLHLGDKLNWVSIYLTQYNSLNILLNCIGNILCRIFCKIITTKDINQQWYHFPLSLPGFHMEEKWPQRIIWKIPIILSLKVYLKGWHLKIV